MPDPHRLEVSFPNFFRIWGRDNPDYFLNIVYLECFVKLFVPEAQASSAGFEPATSSFVAKHSGPLS